MRRLVPALAAALALLITSCGDTGKPALSPVHLGNLHMVTTNGGWATGFDPSTTAGEKILRSADAGVHWRDVSPPNRQIKGEGLPEFLDADSAWIMQLADAGVLSVLRTSDGGAHWQETLVHDPALHGLSSLGIGSLSFVDDNHGWFFLSYSYDGDEQGALYRTADGGATWAMVSATDPNKGESSSLPWQGAKSGIGFVDLSTGWLTSSTYRSRALLYVTHDGGGTWSPVDYPDVPGNEIGPNHAVSVPRFFSPANGYFIVGAGQSLTYRTTDGGATWTGNVTPGCCDASFIDSQTGWTLGYNGSTQQQDLWRTDDGGKHWHIQHAGINAQTAEEANQHFYTTISSLDFVNPNVGFLVRDSGPVVPLYGGPSPRFPPGTSELMKTTDGGTMWKGVAYEVGA